ncbi:hypothetical protein HDF24_18640 [Mucilaginibacter sp. X4EP1]|jgi:hypothetical protein|uniref:hypothetical protein n=1 Tax=Mucilaginibacter sp. X4EP1 TaxID=2723092 RepID=UPI00216A1E69|nr:hypothetical protein [Mucilaginibacter sp. X4EP1]MCS3813408.1 hypothetical protein [Mucilaginibacter sp. X4EP1]
MSIKNLFCITAVSGVLTFMLNACGSSTSNKQVKDSTSTSTSSATTDSTFKPANIREQMIYSRAIEAVNWGMPAVNSELMHQSLLQAGGDYNQYPIGRGSSLQKIKP